MLRKVSFWQQVPIGAAIVCVRFSLDVVVIGNDKRIRLGDPDVTFPGRHRSVLECRLPDARVSGSRLDLDIIGNDETFETQRFEVVLTGFDFDSIECSSGAREALGGCSFERGEADDLVAVIEPFAPGEGITVSGSIAALVTSTLPSSPEPPGAMPIGLRLFAGGEAVEPGAYDKEAPMMSKVMRKSTALSPSPSGNIGLGIGSVARITPR